MESLLFFIIALAVLIVVHEFGHFWVARRCGVTVVKFSVGFGRPLWSKKGQDGTEYILAAIPLGGFVKMLDEREADIAPEQLRFAFNRQSLAKRTAIVAAGPGANLLFAVLAYWFIFVAGIPGIRAIIGDITEDSPAAYAQFKAGDEIHRINGINTPIWSSVNKELAKLSRTGGTATFTIMANGSEFERVIDVPKKDDGDNDPTAIVSQLGFSPIQIKLKPIIGRIIKGGPAEQSGLQPGDQLYSLADKPIDNWAEWVNFIQNSPDINMDIVVVRGQDKLNIVITLEKTDENIGKIGAAVDISKTTIPEDLQTELKYNIGAALLIALTATWNDTKTIVTALAGMITGDISSKNIGGPISIAQIAGASAQQGMIAFISLLAILSVNLAVLNLLPIPVLDGGHLVIHFIEWIRGKPLTKELEVQLQQVGIVLLMTLIVLAFANDLARLFGS